MMGDAYCTDRTASMGWAAFAHHNTLWTAFPAVTVEFSMRSAHVAMPREIGTRFAFAALPSDAFDIVCRFLKSRDLFALSHCSSKLHRHLLCENGEIWISFATSTEHHSKPRRSDLLWIDEVCAQFNVPAWKLTWVQFKQTFKRRRSSIDPSSSWKAALATSRALRLFGLRRGKTTDQRGSVIALPDATRDFIYAATSFSIDLWFALLPGQDGPNVYYSGGILLGAQSRECIDNEWPMYHQQFIHIDVHGNLYCSMTEHKRIVANLEQNRWYHIALAFGATSKHQKTCQQLIYLDGELVDESSAPSVHKECHWLWKWQLGTGFITHDMLGKPQPYHSGWYPFHGLLDQFRLWRGQLSTDAIHQLALGRDTRSELPRCVWSLKEDCQLRLHGRIALVVSERPRDRVLTRIRTTRHMKLDYKEKVSRIRQKRV